MPVRRQQRTRGMRARRSDSRRLSRLRANPSRVRRTLAVVAHDATTPGHEARARRGPVGNDLVGRLRREQAGAISCRSGQHDRGHERGCSASASGAQAAPRLVRERPQGAAEAEAARLERSLVSTRGRRAAACDPRRPSACERARPGEAGREGRVARGHRARSALIS